MTRPVRLPFEPRRVPYLNHHENLFLELARAKGWRVTKRGWPDFLCLGNAGEWFAVEVKPRKRDGSLQPLRAEQIVCFDFLTSLGVRCYVSDGETMVRYTEAHRRGLRLLRPGLTGRPEYSGPS